MEINQKTKLTTVKNEHYQAMLSHLDNGLQNWHNFSRLDRLEYAYKSLELARNYTCSSRGVDVEKVSVALEIMPYMGYCHSVKTEDGSPMVTTTLSVQQVMSAFKVSPESIMKAALHENTHACDEILLNIQHFENAPHLQFKPGDEILPMEYYQELSQNYRDFGIAWLGKTEEIRANEVGEGVTLDLLKDLAVIHSDDKMYQLRAQGFENHAIDQMTRQYQAETELEAWKAELYQKYLPEGQTGYPVADETLQIQEFEEQKFNYVTIDTVRNVANQNEDMFKNPGYVESELNGMKSKDEVDTHPEIGEQFKATNITCVNQIAQAITPVTTMSFVSNTESMEMN